MSPNSSVCVRHIEMVLSQLRQQVHRTLQLFHLRFKFDSVCSYKQPLISNCTASIWFIELSANDSRTVSAEPVHVYSAIFVCVGDIGTLLFYLLLFPHFLINVCIHFSWLNWNFSTVCRMVLVHCQVMVGNLNVSRSWRFSHNRQQNAIALHYITTVTWCTLIYKIKLSSSVLQSQ